MELIRSTSAFWFFPQVASGIHVLACTAPAKANIEKYVGASKLADTYTREMSLGKIRTNGWL